MAVELRVFWRLPRQAAGEGDDIGGTVSPVQRDGFVLIRVFALQLAEAQQAAAFLCLYDMQAIQNGKISLGVRQREFV